MLFEVPFGVVRVEIIRGKGGSAVTCRVQTILLVEVLLSGDGERHDTVSTVRQLLNPPELAVLSLKRFGGHLQISRSRQCPVGAVNKNLIEWTRQSSGSLWYGLDMPVLWGRNI